jgi:hypothetical protein
MQTTTQKNTKFCHYTSAKKHVILILSSKQFDPPIYTTLFSVIIEIFLFLMDTVPTLLTLAKEFNINYLADLLSHDFATMSDKEQRYVVYWMMEVGSVIGEEAYWLMEALFSSHFFKLTSVEVSGAIEWGSPNFLANLLGNYCADLSEDQRKKSIETLFHHVIKEGGTHIYYVQILLEKGSVYLDEEQRKKIIAVLFGRVFKEGSTSIYYAQILLKREKQRDKRICFERMLQENAPEENVFDYVKGLFFDDKCPADLCKKMIETFFDRIQQDNYYCKFLLEKPFYVHLSEEQRKKVIKTSFDRVLQRSMLLHTNWCAELLCRRYFADLSEDQRRQLYEIHFHSALGGTESSARLLLHCSVSLSEEQRKKIIKALFDNWLNNGSHTLMDTLFDHIAYLSEEQRKKVIKTAFDLKTGSRYAILYADYLSMHRSFYLSEDQYKEIIEVFFRRTLSASYSPYVLDTQQLLQHGSVYLSEQQRKINISILCRPEGDPRSCRQYYAQFLLKYCAADLSEEQREEIMETLLDDDYSCYRYHSYYAQLLLQHCSSHLSKEQRKELIETIFNDVLNKGDIYYAQLLLEHYSPDLSEERRKKIMALCAEFIDEKLQQICFSSK